jgi:hypothetical protein
MILNLESCNLIIHKYLMIILGSYDHFHINHIYNNYMIIWHNVILLYDHMTQCYIIIWSWHNIILLYDHMVLLYYINNIIKYINCH